MAPKLAPQYDKFFHRQPRELEGILLARLRWKQFALAHFDPLVIQRCEELGLIIVREALLYELDPAFNTDGGAGE